MMTRMSFTMASSILRKLSAWRSSREEVQLAELGDAVHAARDFVAELFADLFDRDAGIFDDVVQQPGLQRHHVHLHVGENERDLNRVRHVCLTRVA